MFTWIISNILFSIPTVVWSSIAIVGFFIYFIAGHFTVPFINVQASITRLIGVAAMVVGVFMWGGSGFSAIYKAQLDEHKEKLRIAEEKSQQVNVVIEEKVIEKIKYVRGRTEYITRYLDREITKYDTKFISGGTCEIPKEFIHALNAAAKNNTDGLNNSTNSSIEKGISK